MIKPVKHSAPARTSMKVLKTRVCYIADPEHKNHKDKIVLPSKNHHCVGQEVEDFVHAIVEGLHRYCLYREGKKGKRTKRRWEEYCYSSEEGKVLRADGSGMESCLSLEEREEVERRFLKGAIGRGAVRFGWHIDLITGRCDCHFLAGVHDEMGVVWINDGFGHGKRNLKLELERIEEELLKELNRRRKNEHQLKTPRQRHRENRVNANKLTFAQKLAAARWDGSSKTLANFAEQAGYFTHAQTKKTITVHSLKFKKDPKKIRYTISTLTTNWSKAKTLLDRKKQLEKDDPDM